LENAESKINDGKRAAAKQLKKGLLVISSKINHGKVNKHAFPLMRSTFHLFLVFNNF